MIVDIFGYNLIMLPNAAAAIVCAHNAQLREVIPSVELLLEDLRLRQSFTNSPRLAENVGAQN
jgi:hypothetical protein